MRVLSQSALRFLPNITFRKHKVRKAGSVQSFADFTFIKSYFIKNFAPDSYRDCGKIPCG